MYLEQFSLSSSYTLAMVPPITRVLAILNTTPLSLFSSITSRLK